MPKKERELYGLDIEHRISQLQKCEMSKKNKEIILTFLEELYAQGMTDHRVAKYISSMKRIFLDIGKDFDTVTEQDLKRYVGKLERSDLKDWTKHDRKIILRIIYKWQFGKELTWVHTKIPRHKRKLPTELITEDEVQRMIGQAWNPRDRAMIALLWDAGLRIGELASMKIGSFQPDEKGAVIFISGKTGMRRIRTVFSVPYMLAWIEKHPEKENPHAPLWIVIGKRDGKWETVTYYTIRSQLQKIATRAGVKKNVNPHQFRHSRATYMASYMTPSQLCTYFGWTPDSDMPGVYVHLSGTDLDDIVFKANGTRNIE